MRNNLIVFGIAVLVMGGCATIMDESTQLVLVETPWCSAAKCTLTNNRGTYVVRGTPDSVLINKSSEDLVMVCERDGHKATEVFESSANGYMTAGNVLLFGGILGLIVDDGSDQGYDYNVALMLPLDCGDEPDEAAQRRFALHEQERLQEPEHPGSELQP